MRSVVFLTVILSFLFGCSGEKGLHAPANFGTIIGNGGNIARLSFEEARVRVKSKLGRLKRLALKSMRPDFHWHELEAAASRKFEWDNWPSACPSSQKTCGCTVPGDLGRIFFSFDGCGNPDRDQREQIVLHEISHAFIDTETSPLGSSWRRSPEESANLLTEQFHFLFKKFDSALSRNKLNLGLTEFVTAVPGRTAYLASQSSGQINIWNSTSYFNEFLQMSPESGEVSRKSIFSGQPQTFRFLGSHFGFVEATVAGDNLIVLKREDEPGVDRVKLLVAGKKIMREYRLPTPREGLGCSVKLTASPGHVLLWDDCFTKFQLLDLETYALTEVSNFPHFPTTSPKVAAFADQFILYWGKPDRAGMIGSLLDPKSGLFRPIHATDLSAEVEQADVLLSSGALGVIYGRNSKGSEGAVYDAKAREWSYIATGGPLPMSGEIPFVAAASPSTFLLQGRGLGIYDFITKKWVRHQGGYLPAAQYFTAWTGVAFFFLNLSDGDAFEFSY